MVEENQIIVPFLKWAGGKRWLANNHQNLFPTTFDRYIEPFLGSAAVYFLLKPKSAILADINPELVNVYTAVKKRPDLIKRYLRDHQKNHSKSHYYLTRGARPSSEFLRAARTIYLNRACWNALYRVNKQGEFNVPIGTKSNIVLSTDNFEHISHLLKRASLFASDFEPIINRAQKNDFVFVDPPYTVKHNLNGFVKYNENIFSWNDQIRLRNSVEDAVSRGAKVFVTNADHKSIRDLYKGFLVTSVKRHSVIAGKSSARGIYGELVIRCW